MTTEALAPVTAPRAVTVRTPGKVNVVLGVGPLRADGYHDLGTVFQALSLYETVTATHARDFSLAVRPSPEAFGRIDVSGVPLDGTNLALRAAMALAQAAGYPGAAHLQIEKGVPVAGGMGGGSADAAAALVACNELWGTGRSLPELHEIASGLGADVPFLLHGGTALASSKGEDIAPLLVEGRFEWVLVTSPKGLSTPAMYRALDDMRGGGAVPDAVVSDTVLRALRAGDPRALAPAMFNDLQRPALAARPELADLIDEGVAAGALTGIVSGSGPTVAFLCADAGGAERLAATLAERGHTSWRAHGPVGGARLV